MKLRNLLLSLFIGVLGICLPNLVDAASLDIVSTSDNSGSRVLSVKLSKDSGESVTSVTLGACKVDNTDVSCTLEPAEGTSYSKSGSTYTFTSGLEDGTVLAKITVTNATSSKISFGVSVQNATIDGTSQTVSTNSSVQAKAVEKTRSSDASLKSVSFNKINGNEVVISPEFNKDVYEYTVYNIPDTINSIKFNTECNEGECTVNVTGGASVSNKTVTLNQGANTVKLNVTSEDYNSNKTYTFTVYRGETSFNSAKLSSLTFGDYDLSPEFDKDTTSYTLSIPNKIVTLSNIMKYETEDEGATIEADGYDNLVVGENTITIKVTNADGDSTITYTIKVTRLADGEISLISYKDKEITFLDSEGVKTTLSEEEFKEQYPDVWEDIEDGKYEFDEDGNLITEDEEDEEKEDKKSNKTWLIVLIIVIGLAIIGGAAFLIFGKKKPKKDKKNKDNKKEVKKDVEDEETTEDTEETVEKEEVNEEPKHAKSFDEDTREIDEEGIEESLLEAKKDLDKTVSVDEALEDLMKTRQYDFEERDYKDKD